MKSNLIFQEIMKLKIKSNFKMSSIRIRSIAPGYGILIALATKITELFDWFIFYTLDKTNNQLWLFFTDVIIIDDLYL